MASINDWIHQAITEEATTQSYNLSGDEITRIASDHGETFLDAARVAISAFLDSGDLTFLDNQPTTPSLGITPTMLCDALKQYRQEFEGVLSIDLYDSGQEWEGVIVHMPEYSWVIGIHGQDPAWDSNGYLDWSIYKTGIEDGKLYLDEYLGMGVANDSAGWSLEKVVAKICQVIRGGAMPSIPDGFQVGDWVIYSCYPDVYEKTAVVVPEGVEAIGPTRHALGEDMSPVCLWENTYEVRHVREYDGMWYENIFEKYPPEGLTVNRPNLRYEGTIIRG